MFLKGVAWVPCVLVVVAISFWVQHFFNPYTCVISRLANCHFVHPAVSFAVPELGIRDCISVRRWLAGLDWREFPVCLRTYHAALRTWVCFFSLTWLRFMAHGEDVSIELRLVLEFEWRRWIDFFSTSLVEIGDHRRVTTDLMEVTDVFTWASFCKSIEKLVLDTWAYWTAWPLIVSRVPKQSITRQLVRLVVVRLNFFWLRRSNQLVLHFRQLFKVSVRVAMDVRCRLTVLWLSRNTRGIVLLVKASLCRLCWCSYFWSIM